MAVRASLPVLRGNAQVGYASTATWSPLLKKYIALAHLQKPFYQVDTDVRMEITVEHHRQHARNLNRFGQLSPVFHNPFCFQQFIHSAVIHFLA